MLVLTRKQGESICIDGGRIRVTIVDIQGHKVRVGIAAPADVEINRSEIQARIDKCPPSSKP